MSDEHEELTRYDWGPSGVEPWEKGAYYLATEADAALAKLRAKEKSLGYRLNESEEERLYFRQKYEEATSERVKELEAENAELLKQRADRLFPCDGHPAEVEIKQEPKWPQTHTLDDEPAGLESYEGKPADPDDLLHLGADHLAHVEHVKRQMEAAKREPAGQPVGRREFCAATQLLKCVMLPLMDLMNGDQGPAREEALNELNDAADASIYLEMIARLGEEEAHRNAGGYFGRDEAERLREYLYLALDIGKDARGAGEEG